LTAKTYELAVGSGGAVMTLLVALRTYTIFTGPIDIDGIQRLGGIKVEDIQQYRKSEHRDEGVRHNVFWLRLLDYGLNNIISMCPTCSAVDQRCAAISHSEFNKIFYYNET